MKPIRSIDEHQTVGGPLAAVAATVAKSIQRRSAQAVFVLLGLCAASVTLAQKGDPAAGQSKAGQCVGCHGITDWRNGYPPYRVPKLGGQHPEYIASALQQYKSGARAHPTMQAIAATLSDQDVADLAAFLSAR
jgi:cytochrome c553